MSEDMSQLFNTFKNVLQAKSTSNESNTNTNTENSNSELNITPEMISMLSKKLQEQTDSNKNSDNSSDASSSFSDFSSQIDFETILKLKSIMEKFNKKDDPRTNLLHSLKPYLRESRQKKIDEYANLLKIASISDIFKNK